MNGWLLALLAAAAVPLARARLCPSLGTLEEGAGGELETRSPKLRAIAQGSGGERASLGFVVLGPTSKEAWLASGEDRRQLGLKLRATDGCNLLYVMWRLEPRQELVVSIKRNPGQRTHAGCGARGYRNLRPRRAAPLPGLRFGEPHTLSAELRSGQLEVRADAAVVWQGPVEVDDLRGPAGIRSDNLRLRFRFAADLEPGAAASCSRPDGSD